MPHLVLSNRHTNMKNFSGLDFTSFVNDKLRLWLLNSCLLDEQIRFSFLLGQKTPSALLNTISDTNK